MSLRSLLGLALLVTACGRFTPPASTTQEAWNPVNDPRNFGVTTQVYSQIPTAATLPTTPWSDYYWATYRGGLSYRWQHQPQDHASYRAYLYQIPSASQLQSMSERQLATLSPAEKYDLVTGRVDLPLTRAERDNTLRTASSTGEVPTWYGLCHGWAAAAYMEQEPGAQTVATTPDGRRVTFYASDLKALITKMYADAQVGTRVIGGRCNAQTLDRDARGRVLRDECRDTNPASLHLVVADRIARQQRSFVAEVDEGAQVWNQPVSGYRFQYANLRRAGFGDAWAHVRAPGTEYLVDVDMVLSYVVEVAPAASPVRPAVSSKRFRYTLELDGAQRIIGGEWLSQERPDFLWELDRKPEGRIGLVDASLVRQLVAQSLGGVGPIDPVDPVEPIGGALVVSSIDLDRRLLRNVLTVNGTVRGSGVYTAVLSADFGAGSQVVTQSSGVAQGQQFRLVARWPRRALPATVTVDIRDRNGRVVDSKTYAVGSL